MVLDFLSAALLGQERRNGPVKLRFQASPTVPRASPAPPVDDHAWSVVLGDRRVTFLNGAPGSSTLIECLPCHHDGRAARFVVADHCTFGESRAFTAGVRAHFAPHAPAQPAQPETSPQPLGPARGSAQR
jgi:hypothetical protein